jgi:hypothetical protein
MSERSEKRGVVLAIILTGYLLSGAHGAREVLANRVSASLTVAVGFLVLALLVTLLARPRRATAEAPLHDLSSTQDPRDADALAHAAA